MKIKNMSLLLAAVAIFGAAFWGCKKNGGDNYKVHFKVLRQNNQPAAGFRVDAWVKGKSPEGTKITKTTGADGMAEFDELPFPDAKHQLVAVLHYFTSKMDQEREMDYPFIQSDAVRLKDTQYIPNNATPDPQ